MICHKQPRVGKLRHRFEPATTSTKKAYELSWKWPRDISRPNCCARWIIIGWGFWPALTAPYDIVRISPYWCPSSRWNREGTDWILDAHGRPSPLLFVGIFIRQLSSRNHKIRCSTSWRQTALKNSYCSANSMISNCRGQCLSLVYSQPASQAVHLTLISLTTFLMQRPWLDSLFDDFTLPYVTFPRT